jgi:hypothetical protein
MRRPAGEAHLFSGHPIQGSGFYITDYAHKNIPTKEEGPGQQASRQAC